MNKYNSIGKIVATYGYQGEVVLQHNLEKKLPSRGLRRFLLKKIKTP